MGLNERISRLESNQPPEKCPKCHDQQFAVYVRGGSPPEPCPKCHKTPGYVVEAWSEESRQLVERLFAGERTENGGTNWKQP